MIGKVLRNVVVGNSTVGAGGKKGEDLSRKNKGGVAIIGDGVGLGESGTGTDDKLQLGGIDG